MADKVALLVENESLRDRVEELEEALEEIATDTSANHEGGWDVAYRLRDRARRALDREAIDE